MDVRPSTLEKRTASLVRAAPKACGNSKSSDRGPAIVAAVIAVVGIILGALLTGVVTFSVERRKSLLASRRAILLVASELRATLLVVGDDTRTHYWMGELPTSAWTAHNSEMTYDLRPGTIDLLTRSIKAIQTADQGRLQAIAAMLSTSMQAESDSPTAMSTPRLSESGRKALSNLSGVIQEVLGELDRDLHDINKKLILPVRLAKSALVVVFAIVVIGLIVFATTSREYLTPVTVSQSLEEHFGQGYVADCDAMAGDWRCEVTKTRPCPAAVSPSSFDASPVIDLRGIRVFPSADSECGIGTGGATFDVSWDGAHLVAVPESPVPEAPTPPVPAWESRIVALSTQEGPPLQQSVLKRWWTRAFQ